jgi:hypothetical protein
MARMTNEEFTLKQEQILANIPPEIQPALRGHAYHTGHAYGNEEILCHLVDLVDSLEKPLKDLEERIIKQANNDRW